MAKRKPKYRPSPSAALKASGIKDHRGMFAVVFDNGVLLAKRANYRAMPSTLLGKKLPVFLAKDNADAVVGWAERNSANVFAVVGDKAIFYNREDALLCMLAFS